MSDSDLVRGLREHDPAEFRRACDRYLPSLWRYVCTRVDGDPHVAEDIVAETMLAFIQAVDRAGDAASIVNPGAWLRTVATNKVQDYFRATARVRRLVDEVRHNSPEADDSGDPVKRKEREERRAEVRQVMDQLPDQYRIALEWKYLDKLSVREIARRWGAKEKAVESILFRARNEFRERLKKKDSDPVEPIRQTSRTTP
ncbi:MAG TPA: RNA polymerase sigma factor [Pirellulales bacterium]|nr:RNA polymerase sigma factor [Pirellulales bacterium]